MQATINLLPRKVFEITLEDGTKIEGQFGTWALKRFCDKLKVSLTEAQQRLNNIGLTEVCEYILAAVEQKARQEGKPFSYNDVHCCAWIDELGGMGSDKFLDLFNHASSDIAATEEKKTELNQTGVTSSEPISQPAEV